KKQRLDQQTEETEKEAEAYGDSDQEESVANKASSGYSEKSMVRIQDIRSEDFQEEVKDANHKGAKSWLSIAIGLKEQFVLLNMDLSDVRSARPNCSDSTNGATGCTIFSTTRPTVMIEGYKVDVQTAKSLIPCNNTNGNTTLSEAHESFANHLRRESFMDSSHSSARSSVSRNSVSFDVVIESSIPSGTVLNAFTEEIVAYEKESDELHAVKRFIL
nr:hypothetical protein [Tanacetum cinerariifolium]